MHEIKHEHTLVFKMFCLGNVRLFFFHSAVSEKNQINVGRIIRLILNLVSVRLFHMLKIY